MFRVVKFSRYVIIIIIIIIIIIVGSDKLTKMVNFKLGNEM